MCRLTGLLALVLWSASAHAGVYTWAGGSGADWTSMTSWSASCPPDCSYPQQSDDVVIFTSNAVVNVNTNIEVGTITFGGGATLNGIGSLTSGSVILYGNLEVNIPLFETGLLTILGDGDATGTGTLVAERLVCELNGEGNECDLSGVTLMATTVLLYGSADMVLNSTSAITIKSIAIDGPGAIGPGGAVPGDIYFIGAQHPFSLDEVITYDSFGSIHFNDSIVTIVDADLKSANEEGLRDIAFLQVTGEVDWRGGTIATQNGMVIEEDAIVRVTGDVYLAGPVQMEGTLHWTSQTITLNSHVSEPDPHDATLTIAPTGLMEATSTAVMEGRGSLIVEGRLDAQAKANNLTGDIRIQPDSLAFASSTVGVIAGTRLVLGKSINPSPVTATDAAFSIAADATLSFAGDAPFTLDDQTTIAGAGTLEVKGGGAVVDTSLSAADLLMSVLLVSANDELVDLRLGTADADRIEVTAGTLLLPSSATAPVLIAHGGTVIYDPVVTTLEYDELDVTSSVAFGGADVTVLDRFAFGLSAASELTELSRLTLAPTVQSATWARGLIDAPDIVVEEGATLELVAGTSTFTGLLLNEGAILHAGGALTVEDSLANEGTYAFDVTTRGHEINGSGTFHNLGRFERTDSTVVALIRAPFVNRDTVVLNDGWLEVASTEFVNDGEIQGTGRLDLPSGGHLSGILSPGLSPGRFQIDGPLVLADTSSVHVEIGGRLPSDEHDQVHVAGDATVEGTARIALIDGFIPIVGDRFQMLTCDGTCSGAFGILELPDDLEAHIEVTDRMVELVVTGVAVSAESSPGEASLPTVLALRAPAPNPVRGSARLAFDLPTPARVRLAVVDALGREVVAVFDGEREAGRHTASVSVDGFAPGLYVVRLAAGDELATRRLIVVR